MIKDKAGLSKHIKLNDSIISTETNDIINYAVNGALFYARHLAKNTIYKKVIAFGIFGNEKRHKITPIFVDNTNDYKMLSDVESFINFNQDNICEYYLHEILK